MPSFQVCSLILHLSFRFSSECMTLSLTFHRRLLCASHSLASLPKNVTLLKTNKGLAKKTCFCFYSGTGKAVWFNTPISVTLLFFFLPISSLNYLPFSNLAKTKPRVNLISANAFNCIQHSIVFQSCVLCMLQLINHGLQN